MRAVPSEQAGRDWRVVRSDCVPFLGTLDDESVDMVATDPPYSSGGPFRGDRMATTTRKYVGTDVALPRPDFDGDNRDQRAYVAWCHLWMSECLRVLKPGRLMCVFTDWRQLPSVTDAIQAAGFVWRGTVVWDKTEGVRPQLGRFRAQAEFVVWGSRGPMPNEGRVAPGVFRYSRGAEDRQHATGKPVALMRDLLTLCPERGLVLDPFTGGGSTALAAVESGRRFVGCEVNRRIFDLAVKRLTAAASSRPRRDAA